MTYSSPRRPAQASHHIDFATISAVALDRASDVLARLLPDGRREGAEWVALNPTRVDRRLGSFRVNVRSGVWADFATGDAGGDLIDLVAYLEGTSKVEAARLLSGMVGGR